MKQQTEIIESKIKTLKYLLYISFLSLISIIFVSVAFAQKEPDIGSPPYKINGKEVKEYLMEKYKLKKDNVSSEIQQTPNGPSGNVHIRGDLTPKRPITPKEGEHGLARAVAESFFAEEAAKLFGVTKLEEIREYKIKKDLIGQPGWTGIYYQRYIDDLPLNGSLFQVFIRPDGMINSVSAYLVPPPELYQAVKKKTLSEDEIRKIVEDDLKAAAVSPDTTPFEKSIVRNWLPYTKTMKMKKLAISSPPYVVWKAESGWVYTINAFTGEILEKHEGWIIGIIE